MKIFCMFILFMFLFTGLGIDVSGAADCSSFNETQSPQSPFVEADFTALIANCLVVGSSTQYVQSLVHVVTISIPAAGLSVATSNAVGEIGMVLDQPSQFLARSNTQIAINTNLFTTCCFNSLSHRTKTQLRGAEVSGKIINSSACNNPSEPAPPPDANFDATLVFRDRQPLIIKTCVQSALKADYAVTGSHQILTSGKITVPSEDKGEFYGPNVRTGVGLSADKKMMWLVAVDRSITSPGVTLEQEAEILQHLGASDAINFDGGGSSTIAIAPPSGPVQFLNHPSDATNGGALVASCDQITSGTCERYVGAILGIKLTSNSARR